MFSKKAVTGATRLLVRHYQVPTTTRKIIPVYPPVQEAPASNLVKKIAKKDVDSILDPNGWRQKLISVHNKERIRAGDVVRVVYDGEKCKYDNIMGYVLSVDRKALALDASLLLRNQISKTFVETRVPLFSPLIERIDIIRRADARRERNKHYYIRGTKLDVGDLEAGMRKRK